MNFGVNALEMPESKVTQKFTVTLPKDTRRTLGVKAGDRVVFLNERESARIIVKPNPENVVEMMGKLAGGKKFPNAVQEFIKERKSWW